METVSRHLVEHAHQLAREIDARAIVLYADAVRQDEGLLQLLGDIEFPVILAARSEEAVPPALASRPWVRVPGVRLTRAGQVKAALLVCLGRGLLRRGDLVVCLTGVDGSESLDSLLVLSLGSEPELFAHFEPIALGNDVTPAVFERTLALAAQLAVEGREGRPVGALFVLGDSDRVLAQSRSLVLNPFRGHPEAGRNILDPALEETLKEFAALDGAFVVRGDGVVLTAGTQLVPSTPNTSLPGGLGTRHAAAAGITASTAAVALCVSQSTGAVTVFKSGRVLTDIHRPVNGGRLAV
jgi:DNA integrity scanning protein DisA with diadenylate cyclase activity